MAQAHSIQLSDHTAHHGMHFVFSNTIICSCLTCFVRLLYTDHTAPARSTSGQARSHRLNCFVSTSQAFCNCTAADQGAPRGEDILGDPQCDTPAWLGQLTPDTHPELNPRPYRIAFLRRDGGNMPEGAAVKHLCLCSSGIRRQPFRRPYTCCSVVVFYAVRL